LFNWQYFLLGWPVGACPGPIFILLGAGFECFDCSLERVGTYLYGVFKKIPLIAVTKKVNRVIRNADTTNCDRNTIIKPQYINEAKLVKSTKLSELTNKQPLSKCTNLPVSSHRKPKQ
jgi:uncharacterized protein (UPF0179 family)